MTKSIIIAALLIAPGLAAANEAMFQFLQQSLATDNTAKSLALDSRIGRDKIEQAEAAFRPQVSAQLSPGYQSVETDGTSLKNINKLNFSVSQRLYDAKANTRLKVETIATREAPTLIASGNKTFSKIVASCSSIWSKLMKRWR